MRHTSWHQFSLVFRAGKLLETTVHSLCMLSSLDLLTSLSIDSLDSCYLPRVFDLWNLLTSLSPDLIDSCVFSYLELVIEFVELCLH